MQFYLQPPHKQGHYCFNGLLQLTKQPLFPDMSIIITLSYMTLADEYSILAASLSFSTGFSFFLPLLLISESSEGLTTVAWKMKGQRLPTNSTARSPDIMSTPILQQFIKVLVESLMLSAENKSSLLAKYVSLFFAPCLRGCMQISPFI